MWPLMTIMLPFAPQYIDMLISFSLVILPFMSILLSIMCCFPQILKMRIDDYMIRGREYIFQVNDLPKICCFPPIFKMAIHDDKIKVCEHMFQVIG
jgi:hypothetical protein